MVTFQAEGAEDVSAAQAVAMRSQASVRTSVDVAKEIRK
jgi:hypothetical protein